MTFKEPRFMQRQNRATTVPGVNAPLLTGLAGGSAVAATLILCSSFGAPAQAQGSPIPGTPAYSAAPHSNEYATTQQATVAPGGTTAPGRGQRSKYQDLPLTADSAKYRLEELRALLTVSKPQDVQSSIQELGEWLNDAADAHYRMYLAFAKSDLTKPQANSEKALNLKFGQLKREAQLLRADLLIKQLRAPEALAPLVEIVAADPRSGTGQAAYKRLVDLGFSQAATAPAAATAAPVAAAAANSGPTALPAMIPAVAPAEIKHDVKTQANKLPVKALR